MNTYSIKLARVLGVTIYLHWTFFILIGWVSLSHLTAGESFIEVLLVLGFLLGLFTCIILHELGHAYAARKFDLLTIDITLFPIGGLARMPKLPDKPREELIVALAGPAVNVVLAVVFYVLLLVCAITPHESYQVHVTSSSFLSNLLFVNVLLAGLNLVPAFPMDGGRAFRALLSMRLERVRATRIAATGGKAFAVLFGLLGLFINPWLVFIALFVMIGGEAEARHEENRALLAGYTVADALMRTYITLSPDESLEKAAHLLLDGQDQKFVVKRDDEVVGMLSRSKLLRGLQRSGKQAPISTLVSDHFLRINDESMSLADAVEHMKGYDGEAVPVVSKGQLIGVIDLENIGEFLMLRKALENRQRS